MRYKSLIIIVLSFFIFTSKVSAAVCDNNHIEQLIKLAEQVDVSYEYIDNSDVIVEGGDAEYPVNSYVVSVNLILEELYISNGGDDYYYTDSVDGIVSFTSNSGKLDLEVRSSKCGGYSLRNISINLPKFNIYSSKLECEKLKEYELDICDPWYQGAVNDLIFYSEVNKYLSEDDISFFDKILNFLQSYYLIIGGGILVVVLIVWVVIIHRKRSVLE